MPGTKPRNQGAQKMSKKKKDKCKKENKQPHKTNERYKGISYSTAESKR